MLISKLCCREILGQAVGLTLSMCLGVWSFASGEELKMIPVLKGLWNRGMVELLTVPAKQEGRSWEERREGFDTLICIWQDDIWRRLCRSSLNYKCEQKGSEWGGKKSGNHWHRLKFKSLRISKVAQGQPRWVVCILQSLFLLKRIDLLTCILIFWKMK